MTDKQIADILLKRASKSLKNPRLVITQQYGKKLYFNIMAENCMFPCPIAFSNKGKTMVFILPELPERLIAWKMDAVKQITSNKNHCIDFDIKTFPKEIVHIFSSAVISALSTIGMGIHLMTSGLPVLFAPDETYEEVQIEADMMSFENGDEC